MPRRPHVAHLVVADRPVRHRASSFPHSLTGRRGVDRVSTITRAWRVPARCAAPLRRFFHRGFKMSPSLGRIEGKRILLVGRSEGHFTYYRSIVDAMIAAGATVTLGYGEGWTDGTKAAYAEDRTSVALGKGGEGRE